MFEGDVDQSTSSLMVYHKVVDLSTSFAVFCVWKDVNFLAYKIGKSHTAGAVWLWELSDIVVFECLRALGHLSPSQSV